MDWIETCMETLKKHLKQMPLKNAMVPFFLFAFLFTASAYFLTVRICDNCIFMLQNVYYLETVNFHFEYLPCAVTDTEKAINKIWCFYLIKQYSLIIYIPIGIYAGAHFYYKEKLKEPLHFLQKGAEHLKNNDLDFSFHYNCTDEMGEICQTFENMRLQLIENQKEIWKIVDDQRQLNAMFAHDLRTPLTVMHGYLTMLKKYYSPDMPEEKFMEILTMLSRQVDRMERFSTTMKDLHSMDEVTIRKKSGRLKDLFQKIREILQSRNAVFNTISVSFYCPPSLDSARCQFDETVILEVLDNLIQNACRFAKTKITVNADLENTILFLYVKDDGCGFSDYDREHAMKPYYSGSGKEQGHFGLGLTIADKLCRKHGGKLEITNSIHGGAIACAMFSVSENCYIQKK